MGEKYMKSKEGIHQAWIVFFGTVIVVAFGMGLMMNIRGVVFSAIIADLGFRSGDLSVYYTICSLTASFSVAITSKLYAEKNSKVVLLILEGMVCGTTFLMGTFSSLWQWYVAAIFNGIGSSCIMLIMGITINNWFRKYNGTLVGIAMAASGVSGTVFNPIVAKFITRMGWRKTIMLMAVIGMALTTVAAVFMIESSPSKVGKRPYGADDIKTTAEKASAAAVEYNNPKWLMPFTCIAFILFMAVSPVNNQLATYRRGLGFSITVGATVTSCSMIGNVMGKLAMGTLADRLGVYKAVNIIQVLVIVSLALFLVGHSNRYILYIAALLYGTIFSVSTTMPPLLFSDLYGPKEYRRKVSTNQMYYSLSVAALSSALPYIYDFTGSYDIVFAGGLAASIASFVMFNVIRKYSQNRKSSEAACRATV